VIPLRVSVKNFLCYHDQVFAFEGHPVWLLHGPNGVGKSTVFDAILYALFGEHKRREGAGSKVEDLVRHGETSARVDFEFEYRSTRYHIWRIRPRKGAPKQGVSLFKDGAFEPLSELNRTAEVDEWVRTLIGMDADAFTSAALLRQGAAERLLDSDIEDRIELYRGIIDVAPYQRLEQAVIEARREVNADVRSLNATLSGQREVPDAEVAEAIQTRDGLQEAWEQCREAERIARDRLAASQVWDELNGRARELRELLQAATNRSTRVGELEAAVRRLNELREVIPALERFTDAARVLAETQTELVALTLERNAAEQNREALRASADSEKQKAEESRGRVAECDRAISRLDEQLRELRRQIEQAENAAELHRSLREAEERTFDADLDEQFERAADAVEDSRAAKAHLPALEAALGHRNAFREATEEEFNARSAEGVAKAERDRLRAEVETAATERERFRSDANEADKQVAVAEARLDSANEALADLDSLEGQAACSLCRQPLGPDCIEHARASLKKAVHDAKAESKYLHVAAETAADAAKAAESRCRELTKQLQGAEKECSRKATEVQLAEHRVVAARSGFTSASAALPSELVKRIGTIEAAEFPTEADLEELREAARKLTTRSARHEQLRVLRSERDQAAALIANLKQAVAAVGAPADVSQARAEAEAGDVRRNELEKERSAAEQSRIAAEAARSKAESQLQIAEHAARHLEGRFGAAEAKHQAAEREHGAAREALPGGSEDLDVEALRSECDRLEAAGVERDFAAVSDDAALKTDREARLIHLEGEIEARVPPEARKPSSELAREADAAERGTQDAERVRDRSRKEFERLEAERARRAETCTRLEAASRKHGLHERLVELLGAEGIQNALVQQAEARIIGFANETLTRVSNGNLHLEPAPNESRIAVRYRGQPIPADNLSSGQRCRAAVSLALAVCRFAGDEARPLQSVIIDEAFANLDREGRMAMVSAIHDETVIGGRLERIIVVSHHEDVAAAFPVGYRLSNDGARTIATRTPE
jgi:exonuclease SbcC